MKRVLDHQNQPDKLHWLKVFGIWDFLDEFGAESDRGCAILGICQLEEFLKTMIKWRLGDHESTFMRTLAPRGRMSMILNTCGLIGLLSEKEVSEGQRLIRIRNDFAHKLSEKLSFKHPIIANEIQQLRLVDGYIPRSAGHSPRTKFLLTASLLQIRVAERSAACEKMHFAAEHTDAAKDRPDLPETDG